jgi:hypothetical protein
MAAESPYLADRAEHYRELAADIRDRAASMKTPAARDALVAVANDYELLARYADSLVRTWRTLPRWPDQ